MGWSGTSNCAPEELPAPVGLARLGWVDPLAGGPASRAAVHPKRIDWMLLDKVAQWLMRGYGSHVAVACPPLGASAGRRTRAPGSRPAPEHGGGGVCLHGLDRAMAAGDAAGAWSELRLPPLGRTVEGL